MVNESFPVLPFSQLVYDMTRWMPSVYTFRQDFLIRHGAKKQEHIESALRKALSNHPVFSSAINCKGRQYAIELKDILHGKYHDFRLKTKGDDLIIRSSVNRILGDGKSFEILIDDILRAYEGKHLEADNFWEYLQQWEQQQQGKHYSDSKAWLEQEFGEESVPVRPKTDRRRIQTLLPWKAGELTVDYTDIQSDIYRLAESEHLSLDGFFSLCVALAIMDYCGTDEAALTWAYEGRETPEEQRIIGSLHRDVAFKISRETLVGSRENVIRQARNQIRSGIAHSDYPYTLTNPHTARWNYAVNVIRQTSPKTLFANMPYDIEPLPQKPNKTAYALLDVEYYDEPDSLRLTCRYSATHYKEESIKRFATLIRQNAEWIIER